LRVVIHALRQQAETETPAPTAKKKKKAS
jgi:hypothetical protein